MRVVYKVEGAQPRRHLVSDDSLPEAYTRIVIVRQTAQPGQNSDLVK